MAGLPAYVVDAFAVLALLQDEPGAAEVQALLAGSVAGEASVHMCSVNAAEVLYAVWRRTDDLTARTTIADLQLARIRFHDVDLPLSLKAGALKAQYPLALGGCYAAALTQHLDATLVTGDPEFRQMQDIVRIEWIGGGN